jgi:ABC-type molybdate transport system substrate-binding protein
MPSRYLKPLFIAATLLATPFACQAQTTLRLFAASSLTGPLSELGRQFSAQTGIQVDIEFGPSGVLQERIEKGEPVDVFASANMTYPLRLEKEGKAASAVVFTRNRLCVLARPDLELNTTQLLTRLLAPATRIGTSTPGDDPGGDYAWMMFDKAGRVVPGADAVLKGKAMMLVGGRHSPAIPAGQDPMKYYLLTRHQVDTFVGYCSTRTPGTDTQINRVELPPELAIAADYGVSVLTRSAVQGDAGYRFALFLLSPASQRVMTRYGYTPVTAEAANGNRAAQP